MVAPGGAAARASQAATPSWLAFYDDDAGATAHALGMQHAPGPAQGLAHTFPVLYTRVWGARWGVGRGWGREVRGAKREVRGG